jgi:hypothetical protein
MNEAVPIGALTSKIVDPWAWWRAALKNPSDIGKSLPVHDGDPQQGYYRTRRAKGEAFEPVAIYYPDDSNTLVALRGTREVDPNEIWTFCCKNPVEYQAYIDARAGKGWPDDDAEVAAQVAPPAPGDNSAVVDEAETIKDQIESALAGVKKYETIADDATAAKALSLRNRLNELSNQADKIRTKQKEPHLEAGRAVDAKWQPLVKSSKAGADKVRDAMGAWETEKLRRQREEERQRAEAIRLEQEAARAAEATGKAPETEVMAPPPPAATAPAPIKPTYGKAASVSVKVVLKDITDWRALADYMLEHPIMQDTLRQLAQRALDAGRTNIPGITTEERASVK